MIGIVRQILMFPMSLRHSWQEIRKALGAVWCSHMQDMGQGDQRREAGEESPDQLFEGRQVPPERRSEEIGTLFPIDEAREDILLGSDVMLEISPPTAMATHGTPGGLISEEVTVLGENKKQSRHQQEDDDHAGQGTLCLHKGFADFTDLHGSRVSMWDSNGLAALFHLNLSTPPGRTSDGTVAVYDETIAASTSAGAEGRTAKRKAKKASQRKQNRADE